MKVTRITSALVALTACALFGALPAVVAQTKPAAKPAAQAAASKLLASAISFSIRGWNFFFSLAFK